MNRKTVLLLALAVVMCFVFAVSCGSSPAPESEPAPAPPPPSPPRTSPSPTPPVSQDIILDGARTYTVVSRDTLSSISRRLYGRSVYYPLIMLGSKDVVQDMDKIKPGMRLTIPDLQRNLNSPGPRARIKSFLVEIAALNDSRRRPKDAAELRKLANSL